MIIDFRLRPPVGGFLNTLMYSAGARRDGFTRTVGFTPSPRSSSPWTCCWRKWRPPASTRAWSWPIGRRAGQRAERRRAPDRGRASGPLHRRGLDRPDRPPAGCRTIDQALADGFKLINIEPGSYPVPMHADDRRLYPIYGHCEDVGVPVIMMVGGTAGPDLSYSDPIRTDRVLADFPNLNVVVAHGGWPWVNEILHLGFRRQNLWLSPDMYFSRMPGWEEYVKAADGFLSDRMLYASSFPFCPVREYKSWFESLPIKEENLRKIMGGNARRLLGIPARNP